VHDRLRDLVGDRLDELDLGRVVLARDARADVERAGELLAVNEDRHGEDRLVLRLRQVGEELEAWIEVRLGRDHHGRPLGRCTARDPLTGSEPRSPGHLLDARPVGGPEDELVAAVVVQVDEAGIRVQGLRDARGDEMEDLFEIERRVDRRRRLGQQSEMPLGRFHAGNRTAQLRCAQWPRFSSNARSTAARRRGASRRPAR
jgi:hypothetical protein